MCRRHKHRLPAGYEMLAEPGPPSEGILLTAADPQTREDSRNVKGSVTGKKKNKQKSQHPDKTVKRITYNRPLIFAIYRLFYSSQIPIVTTTR